MKPAIRVGREKVIHEFWGEHAPAAVVESGARLIFETLDAYNGHFHRDPDIHSYLEKDKAPSNPATGPVFLRGLCPGDGLDATIERIDLTGIAYLAIIPGLGVLGDTLSEPRLARLQVKPDGLWYEGRIRLPLRPMVGVIGVAPTGPPVRALEQGYHGGNLDCREIGEGTTVHLPVFVAGGLLAVGDVHANMGAGEPYSGININASVTLTVRRVPRAGWERVWFETDSEVMTVGVEDRIEDAIREANAGMVEMLVRRLGVTHSDAVALCGAACDIRLGQASVFSVRVSAYAAFPKVALE